MATITCLTGHRLLEVSFAPPQKRQLLERAITHDLEVWIPTQHKGNPDDPDLAVLYKQARLYEELPKKML